MNWKFTVDLIGSFILSLKLSLEATGWVWMLKFRQTKVADDLSVIGEHSNGVWRATRARMAVENDDSLLEVFELVVV